MLTLEFKCPKCKRRFWIKGYWKWIFNSLFHWFNFKEWADYRKTKCPHCMEKTYMTWEQINR